MLNARIMMDAGNSGTRGNDRERGVEPGRAKNEEPGPGTRIEDQERGIGPGEDQE